MKNNAEIDYNLIIDDDDNKKDDQIFSNLSLPPMSHKADDFDNQLSSLAFGIFLDAQAQIFCKTYICTTTKETV